jgi:hypothetical protein
LRPRSRWRGSCGTRPTAETTGERPSVGTPNPGRVPG